MVLPNIEQPNIDELMQELEFTKVAEYEIEPIRDFDTRFAEFLCKSFLILTIIIL